MRPLLAKKMLGVYNRHLGRKPPQCVRPNAATTPGSLMEWESLQVGPCERGF